jgi:hypothetical protein
MITHESDTITSAQAAAILRSHWRMDTKACEVCGTMFTGMTKTRVCGRKCRTYRDRMKRKGTWTGSRNDR